MPHHPEGCAASDLDDHQPRGEAEARRRDDAHFEAQTRLELRCRQPVTSRPPLPARMGSPPAASRDFCSGAARAGAVRAERSVVAAQDSWAAMIAIARRSSGVEAGMSVSPLIGCQPVAYVRPPRFQRRAMCQCHQHRVSCPQLQHPPSRRCVREQLRSGPSI